MTTETPTHDPDAEFYKALIKAKAQFEPLHKTKTNPHFKSAYAGLDDIAAAVDAALAKNGFNVVHQVARDTFITTLRHVGGGYAESVMPMPAFDNPQKMGSWITYAKRYGKAALLDLVADEDDDGNAAAGPPAGVGGRDSSRPAGGSQPGFPSNDPPPADLPGRARASAVFGKLKDEFGDEPPWEGQKGQVLEDVFGTKSTKEIQAMHPDEINDCLRKYWDKAILAAKGGGAETSHPLDDPGVF